MYSDIIDLLKKGKASRDKEQVRKVLHRVLEYLERISFDSKLRNQVIADEEHIFPIENEKIYRSSEVDYSFSTSGYLNQVIDILGVNNGEEHVRKLQEAIEDLHSAISSGQEYTEERQSFKQVLEQFKILIE